MLEYLPMNLDPFDMQVKNILIAQLADILTTAIGYWVMGFRELNPLINIMPMWGVLIVKVLLIAFVVWALRLVKYLWVYKTLFWISAVVVVWNVINIILELAWIMVQKGFA